MQDVALVRRIGGAFLVNGVAATIWLAATPALAAEFGTTIGGFGAAFVAFALGGIAGTRLAPPVVRRLGSGRTTVFAGFAVAALLALRAVPPGFGWFVAAQVAAGLADGLQDVAMNVVAVGVDARQRRPIVNRLHAVWSLGAVLGGLAGAALAAADATVATHFLVAAAIVGALNLTTTELVAVPEPPAAPPRPHFRWWHSRALVALAAMGVAGSVLEGAPLDWGTLYLADELDAAPGVAAAATITFTAGMVGARIAGDHLVDRFGVPFVLRIGAAAAAIALAGALAFPNVAVVLVAWFVVGAGVATAYPALFVAAGRAPHLPPGVGIGAVASVARIGFLLGPALIGALADRTSLRVALTVPAVAALCIVALAGAARRPDQLTGTRRV
jgi:MFS family permease